MRPSRAKAGLCIGVILVVPALGGALFAHVALDHDEHAAADHVHLTMAAHGHSHDESVPDHEHPTFQRPVRCHATVLAHVVLPVRVEDESTRQPALEIRPPDVRSRIRPPLLI